MREASVGFQCPACAGGAGLAKVRQLRTRSGARVRPASGLGGYSATVTLIGIRIVVGLASLITAGRTEALLAFSGQWVAAGQFWRLVTHSFTSFGLLNLAINSLFLFFVGRAMEAEVGRWRIFASYLVSGFIAASLLMATLGAGTVLGGGTAAMLGLFAMYALVKYRRGEDIRADLILIGIFVALGIVTGGGLGYLIGMLGGAAGGAVLGLVFSRGSSGNRTRQHIVGTGLVVLAGVLLSVVGLLRIG